MQKSQAEENIQLIRDVMERSVRYTHFSGLSGVLSGILTFIGCGITWWASLNIPVDQQNAWYIVIWSSVLVAAIVEDLILAHKNAAANGSSIWVPATFQVMKAIFPGLFVAFIVSLFALQTSEYHMLPGVWSLGYGAALCAAGMFSIKEVGIYGIIQLITGAIGLLFFRPSPYYFYQLALSFGVYQILFGLWIAGKYRK